MFLARSRAKVPWHLDTHKKVSARGNRRKRSASRGVVRVILEDGLHPDLTLNLRPRAHPVTQNTIVEWFHEDGAHSVTRGLDTSNCWYLITSQISETYFKLKIVVRFTGTVDSIPDSVVSLGICEGLSGFIRTGNETLLLEPDLKNSTSNGITHVIYPLILSGQTRLNLTEDEDFGTLPKRRARSIRFNQVDYDEFGNEITDTIDPEELINYLKFDGDEEDNEISNKVDSEGDEDDVVILDTYVELEDYDVHPPPQITVAQSPQDILDVSLGNETAGNDVNIALDVDGFPVDKLWEGINK